MKELRDEKKRMILKTNLVATLFDVGCFLCLIVFLLDEWVVSLPEIFTTVITVMLIILLVFRILKGLNIKKVFCNVELKSKGIRFLILLVVGIVVNIYILGVFTVFENFSSIVIFTVGEFIYLFIMKKEYSELKRMSNESTDKKSV